MPCHTSDMLLPFEARISSLHQAQDQDMAVPPALILYVTDLCR